MRAVGGEVPRSDVEDASDGGEFVDADAPLAAFDLGHGGAGDAHSVGDVALRQAEGAAVLADAFGDPGGDPGRGGSSGHRPGVRLDGCMYTVVGCTYTERTELAMTTEITYSERHRDYTLTADGNTIATAHCANVTADIWSVKLGARLLGLVRGEANAKAQLDTIAAGLADA